MQEDSGQGSPGSLAALLSSTKTAMTSAAQDASSTASSEAQSLTAGSQGLAGTPFSLDEAPAYEGVASVDVHGGVPAFTADDLARTSFTEYAPLDNLGRCGVAFALIGADTMPDEPRGSIGMVKPSGWQTVRYDWVDGEYLFNRCHLIAYQLAGENDNPLNLITGTRSLNVQGMLPYENQVADYVASTGNHVLYRATPLFSGDELVARGVLLEAQSVEDGGAGVRFCTWCYNVEPGVEIDYATGESHALETVKPDTADASQDAAQPAEGALAASQEPQEAAVTQPAEVTYILNTRSHKFHVPTCSSVNDMAEHNKSPFYGTRDEAIAQGYQPCKRCNP